MSKAIVVLRLSPELADYLGMLIDEVDDKGAWSIQLAEALAAARRVPPEVRIAADNERFVTDQTDSSDTLTAVRNPDGSVTIEIDEPWAGRYGEWIWPHLLYPVLSAASRRVRDLAWRERSGLF